MKTLIIITLLVMATVAGAGEIEPVDISSSIVYPVKVILVDDTHPCCTQECIQYLAPKKFQSAIYMNCEDCETCLYEKMIAEFNGR